MPNFGESLQGKDLGYLQIIAQLWGISLADQDAQSAIQALKNDILDVSAVDKMISSLAPDAKAALEDLWKHSGRLPWAQFSRQYGEVREMGPARRDREHPHENPTGAVEVLWYRGLVARAFFDTQAGPEEFAFIPEDLLSLFPQEEAADSKPMGRPAASAEYALVYPANDRVLDHACTFLAGKRMGIDMPAISPTQAGEVLTQELMQAMIQACGLIDEVSQPNPKPVRLFLEALRGEALLRMYIAWRDTASINELHILPDLVMEGKWENDPLLTRQLIIDQVSKIRQGTWWNLDSFIYSIKQVIPDFQRPAGDYDSWFVKSKVSGEYLRGFQHWDDIDGRLVRFLVTGPLYWLGILELASLDDRQPVMAFRLSRWSKALLGSSAPKGLATEDELLAVRSDARISARRFVPRRVRYQVARFCEWEKESLDEYQYRITPASLALALRQGLKVSQLVGILNQYAKAVPPSLIKTLERWEKHGCEARLERMVVLRVASPEILQAVRSSRASRFLGEPLGPASIAVKPGAVDKVLAVLAELGYLGEIRGNGG